MEKNPGLPIFLKAGFIQEGRSDEPNTYGEVREYIQKNIVPFYEKNGFVNIDNTCLHHESVIIMCYPESLAKKYIEVSED